MLSINELHAGYGRADVLRDITLAVNRREIVAVVGPNGAGKTTLLKAIAGVIKRAQGQVVFDGEEVGPLPAHALVRRGLSYVPEGREVFAPLSVEENLWLGGYSNKTARVEMRDRVLQLFPRLAERRHQRAGSLSGGEQQMLAIARGLMSRPKLLLIDEPTLGLAPVLVQALERWLDEVRRNLGTTLLLAEQSAKLTANLSDRTYILAGGRIRAEADSKGFSDEEVFRYYMGESANVGRK